jgi:hypothetical protein
VTFLLIVTSSRFFEKTDDAAGRVAEFCLFGIVLLLNSRVTHTTRFCTAPAFLHFALPSLPKEAFDTNSLTPVTSCSRAQLAGSPRCILTRGGAACLGTWRRLVAMLVLVLLVLLG